MGVAAARTWSMPAGLRARCDAGAATYRDHLLAVAGAAITEQGVDVSLRDIARGADVGLATLPRHFPTREALLEALLHSSFEELT